MVKILWVDDEIELLKPHVLFLRGKGYEVDTCNNGYDAIDMATEGNYDLIILDEMMPGMTGLETLPKIKEILLLYGGMRMFLCEVLMSICLLKNEMERCGCWFVHLRE